MIHRVRKNIKSYNIAFKCNREEPINLTNLLIINQRIALISHPLSVIINIYRFDIYKHYMYVWDKSGHGFRVTQWCIYGFCFLSITVLNRLQNKGPIINTDQITYITTGCPYLSEILETKRGRHCSLSSWNHQDWNDACSKDKLTESNGMATFPRKSGGLSPSSSSTVTSRTSWMSLMGLKRDLHKGMLTMHIHPL